MSIFRQGDLSSEELRQAIGSKGIGSNERGQSKQRGKEVDEDGETSSIVTMWEQTRDRLSEAMSSSDLVSGNI